jgi:hypothetical protein
VVGFGLKNEFEKRARYRLAIICFNARAFAQAKQQLEMILQNRLDSTSVVPLRYVDEQLAHTYRHLGDKQMRSSTWISPENTLSSQTQRWAV